MTIFTSSTSAGLTFDRTATLTAYPAPEWRVSAVLRGPGIIDLAAAPEGSNHRFRVSASATSDWQAGTYWYSIRATKGGDVVEVESGEIVIKPDLAEMNDGHDGRNHVQKVLDAIEAVIEKRATLDQERYRINNRELYRTPIGDLLVLRDRYKAELRRMKRGNAGLFEQSVRVRFRGAS